jgi:ABC-2 type transport system ATP-binding protein
VEWAVIRFENATFDYGAGRPALQATTLGVDGGLTLILGPNGAGKSTMLKLAAGVEYPRSGRVFIDGHDLWTDEVAARRCLAYVPEHPDLSPYALLSEVMRLVCRLRNEPIASGTEALARVALSACADRTVRELSMGQRRRAVLAAALIGHPSHLLLDEPLEGMDRAMQATIVAWVSERAAEGVAVLVATHEIEPFAGNAVRAVAVSGGIVTLHEPLPDALASRLERLEALARGVT